MSVTVPTSGPSVSRVVVVVDGNVVVVVGAVVGGVGATVGRGRRTVVRGPVVGAVVATVVAMAVVAGTVVVVLVVVVVVVGTVDVQSGPSNAGSATTGSPKMSCESTPAASSTVSASAQPVTVVTVGRRDCRELAELAEAARVHRAEPDRAVRGHFPCAGSAGAQQQRHRGAHLVRDQAEVAPAERARDHRDDRDRDGDDAQIAEPPRTMRRRALEIGLGRQREAVGRAAAHNDGIVWVDLRGTASCSCTTR